MTRGRGLGPAVVAAALTLAAAAVAIEPPRDRPHAHGQERRAIDVGAPGEGDARADDADAGTGPSGAAPPEADAGAAMAPDAAPPPEPPPTPVPLPTGCAADLDALHRALARLRSIGALVELAACEEDRGHVATAARHFAQLAAALPARDGRRPSALARAAALAPRVPRWRLRRPPAPWPEGATITLDGAPLPEAQLDVEAPVDPGTHVVETRVPGVGYWRAELRVVEGARHDLPLAWPAPPADPPRAPWGSQARRTALWLESALAWSARTSDMGAIRGVALGSTIGGAVDVAPRAPVSVVLEGALPFVVGGDVHTAAELGSATLGARVVFGPRWLVGSAGIELGVPLPPKSDDRPGLLLFAAGAGELAGAYVPGVRVALPLAVELLRPPFAARAFVAPALLPVGGNAARLPWLVPGGLDLSARAPFGLVGGVGAHGFGVVQAAREPEGVLAAEPFLGFDDRRVFVRTGVSVPLVSSRYWTGDLRIVLVRTTVGVEF